MKTIEAIHSTLAYLRKLSGTTLLIKVGGSILENFHEKHWICEDLAALRQAGVKIVLVHGGGPLINAALKARGVSWEFVEGQRVTTPEIMEVIETVLCGTINRQIVRALNLNGIPAVGISGVESSTLLCKSAGAHLGQVGVIDEVDTSLIKSILKTSTKDDKGVIPVIAPIGIGKNNETFNINADWVASRVAQVLGIKKVLFLTDQDGIKGPESCVLPELDASELEQLIETSVVHGGMLVKTRTILSALKSGVEAVHVINGGRGNALLEELFTESGVGTVCRSRSRAAREVML